MSITTSKFDFLSCFSAEDMQSSIVTIILNLLRNIFSLQRSGVNSLIIYSNTENTALHKKLFKENSISLEKVSEVAGSSLDGDKSTGVSHAAVRITMALVGGFSSNLVYKILHKIVETIQSFILPEVAADPEVLKNTIANQYKEEQMQYTYHLVQELLILQQKYADQEAISQQQLQGLLANYLTFITSPKEYV